MIYEYRQTGWIGTVEVNQVTGIESGRTQRQCLSRLEPGVPIYLHCPDQPRMTVDHIFLPTSTLLVEFSKIYLGVSGIKVMSIIVKAALTPPPTASHR